MGDRLPSALDRGFPRLAALLISTSVRQRVFGRYIFGVTRVVSSQSRPVPGAAVIEFIADSDIYEKVICGIVPQSRRRLWLATADLKDLYVSSSGASRRDMVPFLAVLAGLLDRGVELRLIHAKEPGPNFRQDFDRYPGLWAGLERVLCPRVHFKCVISDGRIAYMGSANLTGAGMGAKSARRRNFENGIISDEPAILAPLAEQFDCVWRGAHCGDCGRREFCADCPLEDG